MNKVAYALFMVFLGSVLTLIAVWALWPPKGADPGEEPRQGLRTISLDELGGHDSRESCWKAIEGNVYDVTDYIDEHPTPEGVFVRWCGRKATEAWADKGGGRPHSAAAEARLQRYLIGELVDEDAAPQEPKDPALVEDDRPAPPSQEPADVSREVPAQALPSATDGRYRGTFGDRGYQQVSLQFYLYDGMIRDITFRHLYYAGVDYLQLGDDDPLYSVLQQQEQMARYLDGRPVEAIFDLYTPEDVVDDRDGFTGATIRASKVISAMRDALNRGIY